MIDFLLAYRLYYEILIYLHIIYFIKYPNITYTEFIRFTYIYMYYISLKDITDLWVYSPCSFKRQRLTDCGEMIK